MPVLFRREVPIRDLLAVEPREAHALQAPIRMAMLELLSARPMSIEELAQELPAHGFRKATNTLRHHLDLLARAGLVELALLEQSRGAVLKYFAASVRPLHSRLPASADDDLQVLAGRLMAPVSSALDRLRTVESSRVRRMAGRLRRCPRCVDDQYVDLVLLAALHRVGVDYLRRKSADEPARVPPKRSARTAGK